MAIERIDYARFARDRRVEAVTERKVEEARLKAESAERVHDGNRARSLSAMDGAVRAHERAHLAALGGDAAGPVSYSTVAGPGGRYASGGSVKVDLSPVPGDPEATLRKAERIRMAALAPASPSAADLRVAAKAYALAAEAKREISESSDSQDHTLDIV